MALEPCLPEDNRREGGRGVHEAFRTAQPLAPRIEASVHPSWGGAPWKVQLYDRDGRSFIAIVGFPPETWAARDTATLSGNTRNVPAAHLIEFQVSADTARRLESEWNHSIGAALAHGAAGADGTTYFFRAGDQCAKTWSPPAGSRNAQLTDLLDTLAIGLDEEELRNALSRLPPPQPPLPRMRAPGQAQAD